MPPASSLLHGHAHPLEAVAPRSHLRRLRHPVRHHPCASHEDFLRKMRNEAQLFATQHAGRKKSGPLTAVTRSAWAFFKSYLLQRACLQGTAGLALSASQSQAVFWKYLSLHEANRRLRA